MLITIDSNESLAKVTAVVGALYGVDLVVGDGSAPAAAPAAPSRRRGRAAAAPSATKRSAGRSRRGGATAKADPKVVRQWAIEQGLTVSTRGQLSKSVLAAYAESNS